MFFIPGFLISFVTMPGVVVHEFAHQWFCKIFNVSVFKVVYYQFGNPAGYVLHERPRNPLHQILIGLGPFFVNSVLGAVIALPAVINIMKLNDSTNIFLYLLLWLGVSIAMHSFPSTGDAQGIWEAIKDKKLSWPLKILFTPLVGLIYVGALGSVIWLDLIYGIAVVSILPDLLMSLAT